MLSQNASIEDLHRYGIGVKGYYTGGETSQYACALSQLGEVRQVEDNFAQLFSKRAAKQENEAEGTTRVPLSPEEVLFFLSRECVRQRYSTRGKYFKNALARKGVTFDEAGEPCWQQE